MHTLASRLLQLIPAGRFWFLCPDTMKRPTVVPLPPKAVVFATPYPIPCRVDPLPASFELKPPASRTGGCELRTWHIANTLSGLGLVQHGGVIKVAAIESAAAATIVHLPAS